LQTAWPKPRRLFLPTTKAKNPNGFIRHRESASISTEKKVDPAFDHIGEFIDSRRRLAGGQPVVKNAVVFAIRARGSKEKSRW
jgi:hypothetical protein